jgi:hypothetical protein
MIAGSPTTALIYLRLVLVPDALGGMAGASRWIWGFVAISTQSDYIQAGVGLEASVQYLVAMVVELCS